MSILSIPWRAGPNGNFAQEPSRQKEVESRMYQLYFTNPWERFMRNDIGIPLMDWVFEPVDEIFEAMVETHAKPMLLQWIDDIQVDSIEVKREEIETDTHLETHVRIKTYWRDLLSASPVESELTHTFQRARQ